MLLRGRRLTTSQYTMIIKDVSDNNNKKNLSFYSFNPQDLILYSGTTKNTSTLLSQCCLFKDFSLTYFLKKKTTLFFNHHFPGLFNSRSFKHY